MNLIAPVVFALILGFLMFMLMPRARTTRGTLGVILFLGLTASVYAAVLEGMGRPKPLQVEWPWTTSAANRAQVLAAIPLEDVAIYVWLAMPARQDPQSYVLPWSTEKAQELQNAMSKAEAEGTAVEMAIGSYESGLDTREPLFYALPQPPMPAKDYTAQVPGIEYVQPDSPVSQAH